MVKPDADDWMPPDKKRLRELEQDQEQEQEQEELTPEETKWWQQWQSGDVHQGSINVKRSKGTGKDDSVLMYEFKFEKKKDGSKLELFLKCRELPLQCVVLRVDVTHPGLQARWQTTRPWCWSVGAGSAGPSHFRR